MTKLMIKALQFVVPIFLTLLITLPLVRSAAASPTLDQVKKMMHEGAIPVWQKATLKIRYVRAHPQDSETEKTWKFLDSETDVTTGKTPLERATTPISGKDMADITNWLRWRILSENADGRYSYAYALNLDRMKVDNHEFKKEAAMFLFHARLALMLDGARCVDQTSPRSVAERFEAQEFLQPLLQQIAQLTRVEKAIAMMDAATVEEMRGERPLLGFLCTNGLQTMEKALASGRKPVQLSPSDRKAPHSIGKSYAVDVSGIRSDIIPEGQWRKKRREILDTYIKNASSALWPN